MTTEQKEKKSGRTKKIFKYLGLSILTLLILLALVVEAPKKLITLLLIILAAFTALPRPYRKYFWLGAAGIVIALIIWILLPINNEGWQPYEFNFDKEYKKLEAKYSIPPEENAAVRYNQLMESYVDGDYYIFNIIDHDPNIFDDTFRNPWLSKDYPEIADWFEHNQNIIETLTEISKIDKCIFPVSDPYSPSDRNSAIRRWARMLVIAINNDIAEGRIDKAIQKFTTIRQMAKHQYQQPVTLDILNGIGVESLALFHFNRIIVESTATDQHLNIIEKTLQDIKNNWHSIYVKTLEYDKLITRTDLSIYYEVNSEGRVRLSRDPWAQLRTIGSEFYEEAGIDIEQRDATIADFLYPSFLDKKLIKAKTILRWFTMPSDPEKAAETLGECLDWYDVMAEPDFDWNNQPQQPDSFITIRNLYLRVFYSINIPWLIADKWVEMNYSKYNLYLRTLTLRRGTRILLAIKQYKTEHGKWPDSLDDIAANVPAEALIDPAGGKFDYENQGERFSLTCKSNNIWPQQAGGTQNDKSSE